MSTEAIHVDPTAGLDHEETQALPISSSATTANTTADVEDKCDSPSSGERKSSTPTSASFLPNIHLVDGDGIITKSENIIEFLNAEVAGVSPTLNSTLSFVPSLKLGSTGGGSISSSSSSAQSPNSVVANFCHRYIRQVVGMRYHVVGVFGGQSSGKSTLLNAAFGTHFATMNAEEGRHQTTKGAFMSVTTSREGHLDVVPEPIENEDGDLLVPRPGRPEAPLEDPLLVVDFEGTDGVERGEDQSLERHLSLFALSIADTLIVNMWTTEVGRFNGGNLSLLRTVFEVNLQLFAHDHNLDKERPTLLFVMRDHSKPAFFAKDCERVRESIDKIWSTITKPASATGGAGGDGIDRFFTIKFFAFPHYELQRKEFIEQLKVFRNMFVSNTNGEKVFTSPNSFRGIPLEAVPQYMASCWESIIKSKDLDIPTQREMLSRFRCKELAEEKSAEFKRFTSNLCARMTEKADITIGGRVNDGKPSSASKPTLQALLQTEFDRLVAEYDDSSRLYARRVVSDTREGLLTELLDMYDKTVKAQCGVVISEVMRNLEGDVYELVDKVIRTNIWQNPAILRIGDLPLSNATTARAAGVGVGVAAAASTSSDQQQPSSNSNVVGDGSCLDVKPIVRTFWRSLCEGTRTLAASVSQAEESVQQQLLGRCFGVVRSDMTLQSLVSAQLNIAVATLIRKRLETIAADAAGAMQRAFEHVLNHNVDGSLRVFSTPESLQKQFRPARYAGLVLAACLFYSRMEVKVHENSIEAILNGDGDDDDGEEDQLLHDSDDDDVSNNPLKRTASNTRQLFARTVNSMSNVTVRFKENAAEQSFYLELGPANVTVDAIASAVGAGGATLATGVRSTAVLGGSDKGGVAVGYGVYYPNIPHATGTANLSSMPTPRVLFNNKKKAGSSAHLGTVDESFEPLDDDDDDEKNEEDTAVDNEGENVVSFAVAKGSSSSNSGAAVDHDSNADEEVESVSQNNILITRSALRRTLQLFHQQIYFTFQVQLTNVEAKGKGAHIPIGMWIALLYFAHDEILYIFRSPVLLILVILACYFFFSAFIQNKWREFEESGPPFLVALIRQGLAMAKPFLEGAAEQMKPLSEIGKEYARNAVGTTPPPSASAATAAVGGGGEVGSEAFSYGSQPSTAVAPNNSNAAATATARAFGSSSSASATRMTHEDEGVRRRKPPAATSGGH